MVSPALAEFSEGRGGEGGGKHSRLLLANVESFCLPPPPAVSSPRSQLGREATKQFCSEVATYFYQRWNAELPLFVMPLHDNQDPCSKLSGMLFSAWTLGFLAYPFAIQKLGAEQLQCLRIKTPKKVLEIQTVFMNVSIFNPGFGGNSPSINPP